MPNDKVCAGAAGTVHDAWDPIIQRSVAIKTLKPTDDEEMRARFLREAQAAGRLIHPNIVFILDFGVEQHIPYIVMELVEGGSLKERLDRKQPLSLSDVASIMQDLLAGLQYSHDKGVVHRDIKPANVLLTDDLHAKIADFGIARLEGSSLTQTGFQPGTPAYMSPEQINGERVGPATDIWSAGVVLYQMLTGERPFEGGDTSIAHKILLTEPIPPSRIRVTVPRPFDGVLMKALAKRPAERFASAAAFAQAVRDAASGSGPVDESATVVVPRPKPARKSRQLDVAGAGGETNPAPPPSSRPPKPPRRWPLALGILALVVVAGGWLVVVAGGWYLAMPNGGYFATQQAPKSIPTPAPAPTPPPPLSPANLVKDCANCPEMVLIPSGSFTMGVTSAEQEREKVPDAARKWAQPLHKVMIGQAFYLGKYAVTVAEFRQFVTATGRRPKGCVGVERAANGSYSWTENKDRDWEQPGFPQTDRDPVVCVYARDADDYAVWLSKQTHQTYRLPSEAEWEYAARAGTTTARYWGDGRGDACLYANLLDATLAKQLGIVIPDAEQFFACTDKFPFTAPVGSFRPNAFGLYDMLGNVWQWTADIWHDTYDGAPADDSVWSTGGSAGLRVLRGGSWYSNPWVVRSGSRYWGDDRDSTVGFRLARTP